MKQIIKFSKNFFFGSATSAHQVEGKNFNDWSAWEKKNAVRLAQEAKTKWQVWQKNLCPEMLETENYLSGKAASHYLRFEEDFDLAKHLSQNAYRFSIEWSLIEQNEGEFNEKEINHYQQMFLALKERGIEPFVTLWHWTIPVWLAEKGGITCPEFPQYFQNFARKMAEEFSTDVTYWITLNEPALLVSNAYLRGVWPPQKKNVFLAYKGYKNLLMSHNLSYKTIKEINPGAQVGFSNNLSFLEPYYKLCPFDNISVWLYYQFVEKRAYIFTDGHNDFLGLNYYFHNRIRFPFRIRNENKEISDLGWEIFPRGIYEVLKRLKKYNLPIFVTENGLADREDKKRSKFIKEHLLWIHKAILEGINVRGYFYWSLLDNFEWDKGFWPRFGLLEVDFSSGERKIRKSALEYEKICREKEMEIDAEIL